MRQGPKILGFDNDLYVLARSLDLAYSTGGSGGRKGRRRQALLDITKHYLTLPSITSGVHVCKRRRGWHRSHFVGAVLYYSVLSDIVPQALATRSGDGGRHYSALLNMTPFSVPRRGHQIPAGSTSTRHLTIINIFKIIQ